MVHEKYRGNAKKDDAARMFYEKFEDAAKFNKELKPFISRVQEDLNPLRVLQIFQKCINEDLEILDLNVEAGRPEKLILTHILAPPVCIRPSVAMDAQGSNEDDITVKLAEIVRVNNIIRTAVEKGATAQVLMEDWDFLQLQCAMLYHSEAPGIANAQTGKPIRGICQRLKGKQGRFRGNLSGKRVDFSGRTVISPDPNLRIDQVAVPVLVAKILTYPERVFAHNIQRLRKAIMNGQETHPGANYVQYPDGSKVFLKFGDRVKVASELKIGDIVERHLIDDDVVLFNRQPSLHRVSIMAHRAKIMPWRTFRFNECVCTPYNADFDGDEMNLHVPQTEEARAEAAVLMSVTENLITPRHGEPLIAATQDFLTSSYLISRKDTFYDRSQICNILTFAFDGLENVEIPPPAIFKPIQLWTGKQIFGVMIKPNSKSRIQVNLEVKSKSYQDNTHMCPRDGWVCFRNSELISGVLDKITLGSGSKVNLFHAIMRDYSLQEAAICMSRLAKMCARWIGNQGFSIGISDVQPSSKLNDMKLNLLDDGARRCDILIERSKTGDLQPQPGYTVEETLEAKLNGELSSIRDKAGELCLGELHHLNAPLIMALCGSKGSNINISQMVACVGQQTVNGSRIPNGFINRSLPHFEVNSKVPPAKGFVRNSFFSGLTPTEFFFHTMGGREGLVDTAVKTAETGYMQRRLMKALEDLSTHYDDTVRNSSGGVVQFVYGDDCLDPIGMESKDKPVNFQRALVHAQNTAKIPGETTLLPKDILELAQKELTLQKFSHMSSNVKEDILGFLTTFAQEMIAKRNYLGFQTKMDSSFQSEKDEILLNPESAFVAEQLCQLFPSQLLSFLHACSSKYRNARMEPGTAVGAIGAQSLGEPGTQMTLKTFHFAGVASMNVTQGVPRIKEIINASKSISTPVITANLVVDNDLRVARIVKGRLETTTLGEVAEYIKEVYGPHECYLIVKLNTQTIQSLLLEINVETVRKAILAEKKLKLKDKHVVTQRGGKVRIYSPDSSRENLHYTLQNLKNILPRVVVQGISGVSRAVISEAKGKKYQLMVEGNELAKVMAVAGVKGTKTTSNHIMDVEKTLGIEAARQTIIDEIQYTMHHHGMSIDLRHIMLVADVMTYRGEVLGITRFGIAKMKASVLMLASFEKTNDHLFEAAVHGRQDVIEGVSECIIMGVPVPLGTGCFKILQRTKQTKITKRTLLLDADKTLNLPMQT